MKNELTCEKKTIRALLRIFYFYFRLRKHYAYPCLAPYWVKLGLGYTG